MSDSRRNKEDNTILNKFKLRSQSFSSFQSFNNNNSNTSPTTSSITSSNSSYSLHHHTDPSNTSYNSNSTTTTTATRRFHSSHLGRPPGSTMRQKPPSVAPQTNSMSRSQSTFKIAPMKEVEKMITDLKKENFDLKLRLYHLEDLITKDVDVYQLNEENCRLKMSLEDRTKYAEGLEREITLLLANQSNNKAAIEKSIGTQTEFKTTTAAAAAALSPITPVTTNDSYPTAFESSPEAFGLLPTANKTTHKNSTAPITSHIKRTSHHGSWQRIKANEDYMSSVVGALQKVKIDNTNNSNNNNIVDSWLNQNLNNHQQGNLSYPIS